MNEPFEVLSPEARSRLRRKTRPSWTAPMLAVLTEERFSDPKWTFERKLDGVRALVKGPS